MAEKYLYTNTGPRTGHNIYYANSYFQCHQKRHRNPLYGYHFENKLIQKHNTFLWEEMREETEPVTFCAHVSPFKYHCTTLYCTAAVIGPYNRRLLFTWCQLNACIDIVICLWYAVLPVLQSKCCIFPCSECWRFDIMNTVADSYWILISNKALWSSPVTLSVFSFLGPITVQIVLFSTGQTNRSKGGNAKEFRNCSMLDWAYLMGHLGDLWWQHIRRYLTLLCNTNIKLRKQLWVELVV